MIAAEIYHLRPTPMTNVSASKDEPVAPPKPTRVFLVDDHPLVRQGLASLLESTDDVEVCGQAGHPRGALEEIGATRPDVAVIDLSLAGGSGLELIRQLRRTLPGLPILVLSMLDQEVYAPRALRVGANGYLMKSVEPPDLLAAIRRVASGHEQWPANFDAETEGREVMGLTDREFEVFELVAQGLATRTIATVLGVSTKTVETHRHRIKEKLGFRSGPELVHYAIRWRETSLRAL